MERGWGVVGWRTRVPEVGPAIVRPRIGAALERAADEAAVVLLLGPAGAGKTTAAAHHAADHPGPVAWYTLGESDDAPGRVLAHLARAVAAIDAAAAERSLGHLADGLPAGECAALLVEPLPAGALLVIDDLHHAERHAGVQRVLRGAIDGLPTGVGVLLLGRRLGQIDLGPRALGHGVAVVDAAHLSFRVEEVGELLRRRGVSADPEAIERASGGWAAGVAFEAGRAARGLGGGAPLHPAADPFFAHLGAQVLDALPADLRPVVIRSALLDEVTAPGLAALEGLDSPAVAAGLCERIVGELLPGVVTESGVRYHPRFAEFLRRVLERECADRLPQLRRRLGRWLGGVGRAEEAVDHLLDAGEPAEAAAALSAAGRELIGRGDWGKLRRWCERLGEERLAADPTLRGLQVRALLMARRPDDARLVVERMRAGGEFARHRAENPGVAAWAVWAVHGSGDWAALREWLPEDGASQRARVIRYIFDTGTAPHPPRELDEAELERGQPLHIALLSALYYRGRLGELDRLAAVAARGGPVTATLAEIYRIAAMRVRGDLGEARAAYERARSRRRGSRYTEFWSLIEAELLSAEGDHAGALAAIRAGRTLSRERGYRVADRAVLAAVEGRLLVRAGRAPEAVEVLEDCCSWCVARGLACFEEWAQVWLGAAGLALHEPPERVAWRMEGAIAGMERAGRHLEEAAAWVILAEARWRMGDEAGHDAAAERAWAASCAMGTLGPLALALTHLPSVGRRWADAAAPDDDRWHRLLRAAEGAWALTELDRARVVVRTLGRRGLEVDGRPVEVVPAATITLAALVAEAGRAGVERRTLIDRLAPASADGANYVRQMLFRLRRALPEGVRLVSEGGRVAWEPHGAVVVEHAALEALVQRGRREVGEVRRATLEAALALAERGPLWVGVDEGWAAVERGRLEEALGEARRTLAEEALLAGRSAEALEWARAATAAEPYREDGWRLLLRATAAVDGPEAVAAAHVRSVAALAAADLRPSPRTVALVEALRRGGR